MHFEMHFDFQNEYNYIFFPEKRKNQGFTNKLWQGRVTLNTGISF